MGREITQPIKTIMNGVSRQPDTVRLPGQIEEGDNILLSVVTGGSEKRPATQLVSALEGADAAQNYAIHAIDRDAVEQYVVLVGDSDILVYDALTGASKIVVVEDADAAAYLVADPEDFAFVTVADHTFIVNKTKTVKMLPFVPGGSVRGSTQIPQADGTVEGNFDNSQANVFNGNIADAGGAIASKSGALGSPNVGYVGKDWGPGVANNIVGLKIWTIVGEADLIKLQGSDDTLAWDDLWSTTTIPGSGIVEVNDLPITKAYRHHRVWFKTNDGDSIRVQEIQFFKPTNAIAGYVVAYSSLPATGVAGEIRVVTGGASVFDTYYVTWDTVSSTWRETVAPNLSNSFDAKTMPHLLVREEDGNFTFKRALWSARSVGDENTVPTPGFIDKSIQDLAFLRNRLGLIADETVFFSRTGDPFNMWPSKAIQVLDTDPIDREASTNKVTLLKFMVPFRKSLFMMAEKAQFEVSSGDNPALTSENATIDLATSYEASPRCRPLAVSEQLYFAGVTQGASVVWEYLFDDTALSNVAGDITKHCLGYVPKDPIQFAASAVDDTLFLLTDPERNTVYVYKAYWGDSDEKIQSAWFRWPLGANTATVHIYGIAVMGSYLYLVTRRNNTVYLERVTTNTEANDSTLGFAVLLDRRVLLTGTYNSGTNKTTWTIPYLHGNNVRGVLGPGHVQFGKQLTLAFPTSTTVEATGDFSAAAVYFGVPYDMNVELSKQFVRAQDGSAIIAGRLQLASVEFSFEDTGYFEVHVTPEARPTSIKKMTGHLVGSVSSPVDQPSILPEGKFSVPVRSRADTVRIQIKSDSHLPCVITGAVIKGEYFDKPRRG